MEVVNLDFLKRPQAETTEEKWFFRLELTSEHSRLTPLLYQYDALNITTVK